MSQYFTSKHNSFFCSKSTFIFTICLSVLLLLQGCAIKPQPISQAEHEERVASDRQQLYVNQEPIQGPLTLEEAIARALKYNYDHRLALMESVFQDKQLTSANLAMLPKLAANAGYSNRDNDAASSSISYETRKETLEPSLSSEREKRSFDLTLTWTMLDFGLSYFQANQQADRLLIMQERKRRVVNNIVKEVIAAYWKVLSADKLLPIVEQSIADSEKALKAYSTIQEQNLDSPLETLQHHRDLLNIISHLRRIQADLKMSRIRLAALINCPLQTSFTLAEPDKEMLTPPPLSVSLEEMENKGLAFRPDLREEAYQERIDKTEVHKEIVRMLPGVSVFTGYNYESNKFSLHNTWAEIGAKTTMGLFNLITGPAQIRAANTKVEVAKTRRLAQTVAALVQINLSYYQYQEALEEFQHAKEVSRIEKAIYNIARNEEENQAQSELALIRSSVDAVRAQIEQDRTLSDAYMLWGNMYFSVGGDMVPAGIEQGELKQMTDVIHQKIALWWQGKLPFEE
ncbi:TolC family protein [Desulfovibrio litoralis]|uniref:Outer membrane protein TolC n=1 Tax=Desulfovibrio litoralis DSM 11393 TaxID=1121455 RepID=A0A1M7SSR5_9BACT|nr:TolC family protein [Desulfovibrio litoralis]SHN61448.1 Outer membrane protein TolC [Desulfovibrio litoralis DSM 11393]